MPMALSTASTATSSQLCVIHLNLAGPPDGTRILETWILVLGNDLRRTTSEVTRIRREFEEGIDLVVFRDQWFKALLDSLHLGL